MCSRLIVFGPPETLRIAKRTAPALFTVKLTVCKAVELVVTVDPTCVQLLPLLVDNQSCQVLDPSLPNTACWIETVPAPVLLKFMCSRPVLRTRAEKDPVLRSVERFPVKASSMNHEPVASITLPAA